METNVPDKFQKWLFFFEMLLLQLYKINVFLLYRPCNLHVGFLHRKKE